MKDYVNLMDSTLVYDAVQKESFLDKKIVKINVSVLLISIVKLLWKKRNKEKFNKKLIML